MSAAPPVAPAPLAYLWGDDDFAMSRAVDRLAAILAERSGAPLERWDLRGDRNTAGTQLGLLRERVATPVMFGGGTLAVVANPGALTVRNEHRDAFLETIGLVGAGNALIVLEASASGSRGPSQRRLVDAISGAGGEVREFKSPRGPALAGWIEAEARQRGLALGTGTARLIAERVGGAVSEGDAERRYQTRLASMELDKLALYRDGSAITVDDVRALVPEAIPTSVWAFTDAIGERRANDALTSLDRLLAATPEPVLLAVLHRRVRELLELGDRLAAGERLPSAAKAMGITSEFRARTLASQAARWTPAELTAALDGLVGLDAAVKRAPGHALDDAQRGLAFGLWVIDHVGPSDGRTTGGRSD